MDIAVSPYHLTTREPPAMAALLLGRRVLTLAPAPANVRDRSTRDDPRATADAAAHAALLAPAYADVMRSWEWSRPLWKAGVLAPAVPFGAGGDDALAIARRIAVDPAYAPLRALMRHDVLADDITYLEAVARDLLKGGPDPALVIPLVAAIDRLAARLDVPVARAHPTSVAQREEAQLGVPCPPAILPVLLQATADRVLHAREVLADVLAAFHEALDEGDFTTALPAAAARLHTEFESRRADILDGARDDEVRAVEGCVRITPMVLPPDAVLRSSLAALGVLTRGPRDPGPAATSTSSSAIITIDPADALPVRTWIVKVVGSSARR